MPDRSRANKLIIGTVVLTVVAIWCGFQFWIRPSMAGTAVRRDLLQIYAALRAYHDTYGQYPPTWINGPDGKPWHSWRVIILPQLGYQDLYGEYRFSEPWNGPNNRKLASRIPAEYQYPYCAKPERTQIKYLGIANPHTAWMGPTALRKQDVEYPDSTVFLVEAANSTIDWMEPRELSITEFLNAEAATAPASRFQPENYLVIMMGGQVHHVSNNQDPNLLRSFASTGSSGPHFEIPWEGSQHPARFNAGTLLSALPDASATYRETSLVAHPAQKPDLSKGNIVWSAALQLAWNRFTQGKYVFTDPNPLADLLNRKDYSESEVGGSPTYTETQYERGATIACQVPFLKAFPEMTLSFDGSAGKTSVKGFGITNSMELDDTIREPYSSQIRVVFYDHESSFGVELLGDQGSCVGLVRMKSRPESLQLAHEQIFKKPERFTLGDQLLVPNVSVNAIKTYGELSEKPLNPPHEQTYSWASGLRFRLDRTGAAAIAWGKEFKSLDESMRPAALAVTFLTSHFPLRR